MWYECTVCESPGSGWACVVPQEMTNQPQSCARARLLLLLLEEGCVHHNTNTVVAALCKEEAIPVQRALVPLLGELCCDGEAL